MSTLGSPSVEVVVNDRALTGESPLWSAREGALYWLDTRAPRIYRLHLASGKRDAWDPTSKVNAIGLRRGGLVAAMKDGIWYLDTATGTFEHILDPEAADPASRLNDAKTDRAGRFWFGSMEDDGKTPTGVLYRLDPDRSVTAIDRGFTIPNGIAWSPDDRRMYAGDSRIGTIFVYDFDRASGTVRNRRPFVQIPAEQGMPDGATVDSHGFVWSARPGAWAVVRIAPDGTVDCTVELPVKRPTSVMFGGDDLRTLYITTQTRGLTPEEMTAQPLAGAVLAVRVDVPGLPEPDFAG